MKTLYFFIFIAIFTFSCKKKIEENSNNSYNPQKEVIEKTKTKEKKFQSGDIIFQISQSGQGKAIQLATNSLYTHCGIIYEINHQFFVYEAIQPVMFTPLKDWINKGEKGHFVTKRLKNSEKILTKNVLQKMTKVGKKFQGKNYDIWFGWSDENIYCSELVWKIYKEAANIEVGKCQLLKDFDLTHTEVKKIMKQRYGDKIPLEEKVISPEAILKSENLETIFGKEL